MNSNQKIFLAINIVGGLLVLASYYWGLKSDKGVDAFWGGVPDSIKSVYAVSMLVSATAFFIFSAYVFKNIGTGSVPYLISFGIIQIASALWMPLVDVMVSNPSTILWIVIRIVLTVVGLAAIAIFILLLKMFPKHSGLFYYSSLIGLIIFIIHTGILDAVIWPYFWKK